MTAHESQNEMRLAPTSPSVRILSGVSRAARVLLSADDWSEGLKTALRLIGEATEADRVYIFENNLDADGNLVADQRFEWTNAGVPSQIHLSSNGGSSYEQAGFERWAAVFQNGGRIVGPVDEFPDEERSLLDEQGIVTLAAVPIMVRSSWWGFLGLDDIHPGRVWGEAELEALGAAAATIGSAVERQRSERALAESERKFRFLIENGFDAVSILSAEGIVLYCSSSVKHVLGYDPSDVIGKPAYELVHASDLDRVASALEEVARNPARRVTIDTRAKHADGSWRWVQAAIKNLNHQPEVQGVVVNFNDITSRKTAEIQLSRRQSEYQALVENSPDVVVRVDTQARFLFMNRAGEDLLRVSAQEVIGKSPDEIEPARTIAATWRAALDDVLEKRIESEVEFAFNTPSGNRWYHSRLVPEFGRDGGIVSVLVTSLEVTKRVQAERRLRNSEEHFRRLIEYGSDLIAVVGPDMSLGYLSPNAKRLLGYEEEENLGGLVADFIHPDDAGKVLGILGEALQSPGRIAETDFRVRHSDGHYLYLSAKGRAVEVGGEINIICNAHDVTARRRMELELQRSEQRFRSLVQSGTDIITIVDAEGVVLYESPSLERVLGYPPEAVIGLRVYDPIHPEDQASAKEAIQRLREGKSSSELFSARTQTADGDWRVMDIVADNKLDEPAVGGIVITSRDVTERQQQLERLETIAAFSNALRKASSASEMPPIIESQLRRLLKVDGVLLALWDPRSQQMVVELASDSWDELQGMQFSASPIGVTASTAAPADREGRFRGTGTLAQPMIWLRNAYVSIAGATLKSGKELVGELWVGRSSEITHHERSLLSTVADMTGNAIQRAMLHEETQARADQLAEVSGLGETLGSALHMDLILERMSGTVQALLPEVSSVLIGRYDQQRGMITAAYCLQDGQPVDVEEVPPIPLGVPGGSTQSEVVRTKQPMVVPDLLADGNSPEMGIQVGRMDGKSAQSAILVPMLAGGQVLGVVQAQSTTPDRFTKAHAELLSIVANTAAVAINNANLLREVQGSNVELSLAYEVTLEGWAKALEMRDQETEGHTRRVVDMTLRLAAELGVRADELIQIRRGAMMHDIGKMAIPDRILLKPGPLNEPEWSQMRKHPQYAFDMLSRATYLKPALEIPYFHHEKWDGSGYPKGLSGEEIPFSARIFAVVDVWDALCSDRPYRKAWPAQKARAYIEGQSGKHFDPAVVTTFLNLLDQGRLT